MKLKQSIRYQLVSCCIFLYSVLSVHLFQQSNCMFTFYCFCYICCFHVSSPFHLCNDNFDFNFYLHFCILLRLISSLLENSYISIYPMSFGTAPQNHNNIPTPPMF